MQETFAELAQQAKSKVLELAEDERTLPPFTLNDHYLQESHLKFKDTLIQLWRRQACQALTSTDDEHIQASLTALHQVSGFSGVRSADLFRTLDLGKDAEAIDLMSKVGLISAARCIMHISIFYRCKLCKVRVALADF